MTTPERDGPVSGGIQTLGPSLGARYAARAGWEAAARTMSAAFSATIITGALVLPEVIVGMIDASTAMGRTR